MPNKQVKIARYHSLGLLKSGAALCFLKAPYLSRYIKKQNQTMPYKMHPKHYENVMSFTAKERYLYFINKVADWEQLWGLYNENEGWLLRTTNEEVEYLSIWPHPEFAQNISKEYYSKYVEEEISLENFMSNLLPKLVSDNVKVGVFPNPEGNTWLMEAKDLLQVLEEECEQYE